MILENKTMSNCSLISYFFHVIYMGLSWGLLWYNEKSTEHGIRHTRLKFPF